LSSFEAKLKENTEYLFNFGELVQREREFLSKDQFERLILSNSFDEFVKIFQTHIIPSILKILKNRKIFLL